MPRRERRRFKTTHPLKYLLATLGVQIIPDAEADAYKTRVMGKFLRDLDTWGKETPSLWQNATRNKGLGVISLIAIMSFGFGYLLWENQFGGVLLCCFVLAIISIMLLLTTWSQWNERRKKIKRMKNLAQWEKAGPYQFPIFLSNFRIGTGQRTLAPIPPETLTVMREIADRDPDTRFQIEYLHEDPILRVMRKRKTSGDIERYVIAIWGEPEKFIFHESWPQW